MEEKKNEKKKNGTVGIAELKIVDIKNLRFYIGDFWWRVAV